MATPNPDIRCAVVADVPRLRDLIERAYRGDSARIGWTHEADFALGARTSDAELHATLADPAARVLLIEAGGAPVGTITVRDAGDGVAYLGMLCVDPPQQGSGLGRRLLAAADTIAQQLFGAHTMEMTVIDRRPEVIAWYTRCGYGFAGEVRPFPEPGDHGLAMVVLNRALVPVV